MSGLILPSYATGFAQGMLSDIPWAWEGLIGAWSPSLGATGKQLLDWSGKDNHATLFVDTHLVPGPGGPVLKFDGVADFAWIEDSPTLGPTEGVTIQITLNQTSGTVSMPICRKYDNWALFIVSWSDVRVFMDTTSGTKTLIVDLSSYVADGEWHTFTMTYDRKYIRLYLDGIERGSLAETEPLIYRGGGTLFPLYFGTRVNDKWWFNGQISDVLIYNRALLPIQTKELHERQKQLVNV